MKMFGTPNFIQHNRLLRLVMLLIVVGLSIFLYTSYYANQTMEPQHFHMPLISVSSIIDADTVAGNDNTFQSNAIEDANKNYVESSNKLPSSSSGQGVDSSNDPQQLKQQFLGNSLNDNLSNSVTQFNVNNIVQQANLAGEQCVLFFHNFFLIATSLDLISSELRHSGVSIT